MSSMSNNLERDFLNWFFGDTEPTVPGTIYVGLSTADPGETGSGVAEPSGGSYARVAVANNTTNWPEVAAGEAKENAVAITFPTATGSWGTITHMFFATAASGGQLIAKAALTTSRTITSGQTPAFAIDAISMTAD